MADICIFYSEPDKDKVEVLSLILEGLGWSVWWDKEIKSGPWAPKIETNIGLTRCVIVIWNSHARRVESTTITEAALSRKLRKPMITLVSEKIDPPLPFNSEHITADIDGWDCSMDAECVGKIIESVESILGIAPKKWRGERQATINLMGKQIKLPCFVKSLSSHETQLDPEAGLTVLNLFPDIDALLVSAYDMYLRNDPSAEPEETETLKEAHEFMNEKLEELNKKGALILLDSGNYEKARKNDVTWTEETWNSVIEKMVPSPCTYAFCYDNLDPDFNVLKNVEDAISRIKGKYEDFLIPILHAPTEENSARRMHELLPDIFFEYASRKKSPFIAVPERELGSGICQKAETIAKIRGKLNSLGRYQPIHILGTGNPLSLLILASAGADLFDGLEWCRTVADRNSGFLFHHQQFEFFKPQTIQMSQHERLKEAMIEEGPTLKTKMGLHNLDFFADWMDELQFSIHSKCVSEMIKGRTRFNAHEFVDEIKKLMPGLIK